MHRFHFIAAATGLALSLAACGPSEAPTNTVAATPTVVPGDALAKIAALPAAQQQLVIYRAIRDAGQECQGITKLERVADSGGRATWHATCYGAAIWVVAIGNDGVAQVTGPIAAGQ